MCFFTALGLVPLEMMVSVFFSGAEHCFSKPDLSGVAHAAGLKEVLGFSESTAIDGE